MSEEQIELNSQSLNLQADILELVRKYPELERVDWQEILNTANEKYLTPTVIAKELGLKSAQVVNKILEKMRYQKKLKKDWYPLQKAKDKSLHHVKMFVSNSKKTSTFRFQLLWITDILDEIRDYLEKGNKK